MVKQMINGTFRQTNLPNESEEYLLKREQLRLAEIELRNQRERVAEMRRNLPQGPVVQDYVFEEVAAGLDAGDSPIRTVRLSQLFTGPNRSVVIYHFMYGKKQTKPCPMCTAWIDGVNGVAHHLAQSIDFAVVAAADLPALRSHARAVRLRGRRTASHLPPGALWRCRACCLARPARRRGAGSSSG